VETSPWHLDVHLAARQPSGASDLTVDWSLDVVRGADDDGAMADSLWLIVSGDGLFHEHEIVHDLRELPLGESRQSEWPHGVVARGQAGASGSSGRRVAE
jgi:hypothetical protein